MEQKRTKTSADVKEITKALTSQQEAINTCCREITCLTLELNATKTELDNLKKQLEESKRSGVLDLLTRLFK